jgi:hypothetical protein
MKEEKRVPRDGKLIIGKTYFVRNPSADSYVGRLVAVIDPFTVALEDASWVAQSGRLHTFVREGKAPNMEIEPVGYVPRARYQSIVEWDHPLFTEAQ